MGPKFRRKLVLPGDLVSTGHYFMGYGLYKVNRKVYAKRIGIVELSEVSGKKVIEVVPIKGVYIPKEGDLVIGKVIDIGIGHWLIDINSPYTAVLPLSELFPRPIDVSRVDLTEHLNVGDLIVARVIAFDLTRDPLLTLKESKLGKVTRGSLLELTPSYLKELIKYKKDLVKLINERYGCNLVIGENGRMVIMGKDVSQEIEAIKLIKSLSRGK